MALSKHLPSIWDQTEKIGGEYPIDRYGTLDIELAREEVTGECKTLHFGEIQTVQIEPTHHGETGLHRVEFAVHGSKIISSIRLKSLADKQAINQIQFESNGNMIDRIYKDVYDTCSYLYESDELTVPFHMLTGKNVYHVGGYEIVRVVILFDAPRQFEGIEIDTYPLMLEELKFFSYLQCYQNRVSFDIPLTYTTHTTDKKVNICMNRPLSYLIIKPESEQFYTSVSLNVKDDKIKYILDCFKVPNTNCYLLPLTPSITKRYKHSINLSKLYGEVFLEFDGCEEGSLPLKVYGLTMQLLLHADGMSANRYST
tara:strand:- start:172 stop:1110 length:939 start_codon:yes stop_codon:yes gene_type:complete